MLRSILLSVTVTVTMAALCAAEPAAPVRSVGPDAGKPRIQIAILLDDSGSMQGLLQQAKQQVWDMVNQLASTTQNGKRPLIEVALYHYGNLPFADKPLLPLSSDLDAVSQQLNAINGGGGTEACGLVIRNATTQLAWSDQRSDLKLIIIAGNEPFTQGDVRYQDACKAAIAKGIQVNTIHCGNEAEGRRGEWDQGAALADGTFLNIDHNAAAAPQIATPQDEQLTQLNQQLNGTYLAYGAQAASAKFRQDKADSDAAATGSFGSRVLSKSAYAYSNGSWDLIDACASSTAALAAIQQDALPVALRDKNHDQQLAIIATYSASRAAIQQRIREVAKEREAFIAAAAAKTAHSGGALTFGQAVRATIAEQARKKGYISTSATTAPTVPETQAVPATPATP